MLASLTPQPLEVGEAGREAQLPCADDGDHSSLQMLPSPSAGLGWSYTRQLGWGGAGGGGTDLAEPGHIVKGSSKETICLFANPRAIGQQLLQAIWPQQPVGAGAAADRQLVASRDVPTLNPELLGLVFQMHRETPAATKRRIQRVGDLPSHRSWDGNVGPKPGRR